VKGESQLLNKLAIIGPLVAGFTVSATLVFAGAWLLGRKYLGDVSNRAALGAAVLLLLAAIADLVYPRIRCSLLRRQTPKRLVGRYSPPVGSFLWGLDTGTVLSTYRASAASFAALALMLAGWGPVWTGVAYAAGFCLPIAILMATTAPAPNEV
jgi:cytochrome c biogenesis protein CcdA